MKSKIIQYLNDLEKEKILKSSWLVKRVNVHRPNRGFLLSIKNGEYEYGELLELANQKQAEMELAFEASDLQ